MMHTHSIYSFKAAATHWCSLHKTRLSLVHCTSCFIFFPLLQHSAPTHISVNTKRETKYIHFRFFIATFDSKKKAKKCTSVAICSSAPHPHIKFCHVWLGNRKISSCMSNPTLDCMALPLLADEAGRYVVGGHSVSKMEWRNTQSTLFHFCYYKKMLSAQYNLFQCAI